MEIRSFLYKFIGSHSRELGTVVFFSVILQVFILLTPQFMQTLIDKVLVQHNQETLHVLAAGMLAVCLFQGWLSYLRRNVLTYASSKVDIELNKTLFRHLLKKPWTFFQRHEAGDLTNRLLEVRKIRQFMVGSAMVLGIDAVFALVYLLILFHYNVSLAWYSVAALALLFVLNMLLIPIVRKRLREKFVLESQRQEQMIQLFGSMATVKTLSMEGAVLQSWNEKLAKQVKLEYIIDKWDNLGGNLATAIRQGLFLLVLWLGARLIMAREMTVGELVAFQMYVSCCIMPVVRLAGLWESYNEVKIVLRYLRDIFTGEHENKCSSAGKAKKIKDWELSGVEFSYRHSDGAGLHDINMQIPAQGSIGIVGPSGAGKTTFIRLLLQMYKPDKGHIKVSGSRLEHWDMAAYRKNIGVVMQEPQLFQGTIWDNIRLSSPQASKAEILQAAKMAGVDYFVQDLPQRYGTLVGEYGARLSGGQRQMIAIARVILQNPQVLILDEATSSLDNETEKQIRSCLRKIRQGRTCIVIAHRLANVKDCDQIYYMEKGTILEQGTHQELIARKGCYYRQYKCQLNHGAVA